MEILKNSELFAGGTEDEIEAMFSSLAGIIKEYKKNEFVLRTGDQISTLCMVLSGSVYIIKEDFWGNRNIISDVGQGEIFAEAYACLIEEPLGVGVIANEPAIILFLDVKHILTDASMSNKYQIQFIRNMISILAEKNLLVTRKLSHITERTTREKLLSYLSAQAIRQRTSSFNIPFNRQELADYLSVDRSAMSNELCKMRDEGMLTFRKNQFTLI